MYRLLLGILNSCNASKFVYMLIFSNLYSVFDQNLPKLNYSIYHYIMAINLWVDDTGI